MRAWCSFASQAMTLTKSNTTRRSQPMMRSRLRRPTSKSTTTVLCPRSASPVPSAAVEVVLPTPPLPDVITMVRANSSLLVRLRQALEDEALAHQRDLHPLLQEFRLDRLADAVEARDRQQLGIKAVTKDAG